MPVANEIDAIQQSFPFSTMQNIEPENYTL